MQNDKIKFLISSARWSVWLQETKLDLVEIETTGSMKPELKVESFTWTDVEEWGIIINKTVLVYTPYIACSSFYQPLFALVFFFFGFVCLFCFFVVEAIV